MIESQTPEQIEQMHTYRRNSFAVGVSTGPTDRVVARQAMLDLYEFAEKPAPEYIFFVRSPLEAQLLMDGLITKKVKDPMKYGPDNDSQVKAIIEGITKPSHGMYTSHGYSYGHHECYWIWYNKYMVECMGVKCDEKALRGLDIMERLATSSGWNYMFPKVCIICDRYDTVSVENGVISNPNGYSFSYSDGFVGYAIEGHDVTHQIVFNPETITVDQIRKEENSEVARIMIQRYGVARYLMDTGAKMIDVDPGLGLEGSAMRGLIEDNLGNRWLLGSDGSTGREYHMPVPNTVNTCREAHEAISGLRETDCLAEA